MHIPPPAALRQLFPTPDIISQYRQTAIDILNHRDPRIALLIGPCSVHCEHSLLTLAKNIQNALPELSSRFFPILRCFTEKPRTRHGWKGFIYDPFLDGTNHLFQGLQKTRKLLYDLAHLGIPCAMEFLHPLIAPYIEDLICWGVIGARTVSSQIHRQLAAGFAFPIGFKNDIYGHIEPAIDSILASQSPQSFFTIDEEGALSNRLQPGNPNTHLVLRGGQNSTNFDALSLQNGLEMLKKENLPPRLLVDCAHGNSPQAISLPYMLEQIELNPSIRGLMVETHLFEGKQPLGNPRNLAYGVSITDSCLSWDTTLSMLTSMSFVQN